MRTALCLLLIIAGATLAGAEAKAPKPKADKGAEVAVAGAVPQLKRSATLPYCRLTLNMASTIDRDPADLRSFDGWWDEATNTLITKQDLDEKDPFGPGSYDPARIVKVTPATRPPAMPVKVIELANQKRAR